MNADKKNLQLFALKIPDGIIRNTHSTQSGHPGGSLSTTEFFVYLYKKEIRKVPEILTATVLLKGHCAPRLYATLANAGFFPVEDLLTLRKIGSHFQTAAGMAKAAKFLKKNINIYTLLGEGEIAEGEVWEAVTFAVHYKLDNFCITVDVNGLQIDGATKDVMNTAPLDKRFETCGCAVIEIDGNNFDELEKAFKFFHENFGKGKPTAILMKIVKGKGISFIDNQVGWHGKALNDSEFEQALKEISDARKKS